MGLQCRVALAAMLLAACISIAAARGDRSHESNRNKVHPTHHTRSLLLTQLTPQIDAVPYPNATINVNISHPQGCVPWWSKKINAGDSVCPKDCLLSGFKAGYNLGQLAPLQINVEKGSISRVMTHPLLGAFLNVTGQTKIDNRFDFTAGYTNNFGLEFVQFNANYDPGASFTCYIGLIKKDPALGGLPIADPKAKYNPYCYVNVTWTVVPPGTIAATPGAAPAATPPAAAAAKPAAQAAPPTQPAQTAAAAAPQETFDANGFRR